MAIIKECHQKDINLTSDKIKAALFEYFRFKKGLFCVSEAKLAYKDIDDFLGFKIGNSHIYNTHCVEVKISKSDFLADFSSKEKHKNHAINYNYFYFCVSADLIDFASEYLKQNYPNYGLLSINESGQIYSILKAKFNKGGFIATNKILSSIVARMSSELASAKIKLIKDNK